MAKQGQNEEPNVFTDFVGDADLQKELSGKDKKSQKQEKSIQTITKLFTSINVLLGFVIVFGVVYVFLQSSSFIQNNKTLDPICKIFDFGISEKLGVGCHNVTNIGTKLDQEIANIKTEQVGILEQTLPIVMQYENILSSRAVAFLTEKRDTKLDPASILVEFNELLYRFSPNDRETVTCNNFIIEEPNTLRVRCTANSKVWQGGIIGFNAQLGTDTVEGTSISLANSFMNYIDVASDRFKIIERPRTFDSSDQTESSQTTTGTNNSNSQTSAEAKVVGKTTSFDLVLQYYKELF